MSLRVQEILVLSRPSHMRMFLTLRSGFYMVSTFTFLCMSYKFFLSFFYFFIFLDQIAQMNDELRAAQGAAAGGSTTEDAREECPKKIKNLEVAMSLSNHSTYREFCVSPSSFLLTVPELNIIFIIEQHKEIRRDGGSQF